MFRHWPPVPLEDLHMWKPKKVKIIKKVIDSKRRLPLPKNTAF